MSLKSTEVENPSRIVRAILISSFRTSSCSQTSFPSIIRPILYMWMMISKMTFYLVAFNCSIFFSLQRLIVSKKIDNFFERSYEARFCSEGSMSIPSSSMYWYGYCWPKEYSRLRFCFCLWPDCNHTCACSWNFLFWWICRNFCVVLNRIDHIFDCSIGKSDLRMRIVLIHGPNSNFNSIFEVLKSGSDFQYKSNSHVSLNPSFLPVKLDHLEAKCIRDKPLREID